MSASFKIRDALKNQNNENTYIKQQTNQKFPVHDEIPLQKFNGRVFLFAYCKE